MEERTSAWKDLAQAKVEALTEPKKQWRRIMKPVEFCIPKWQLEVSSPPQSIQ
jgi:hypothetical protein